MLTKRLILFLFGCIGSRIYLSLFARNHPEYLTVLSYVTFIIGIGFLYIYFFGSKKADAQLEWAGEKTVWWNQLRLFHGINYLLFSILAYNKKTCAWTILAFDTLMGFTFWILHHNYNVIFS